MAFDPNAFLAFGTILVSAGGSLGVTSYVTKSTSKKLEKHEERDNEFHTETIDRLARIETKLDALVASRKN